MVWDRRRSLGNWDALLKVILWFYFRIAVLENIYKAFDDLFYLTFCELGTYPDDETGYFGHMGLPFCGLQPT